MLLESSPSVDHPLTLIKLINKRANPSVLLDFVYSLAKIVHIHVIVLIIYLI